MCAEWRTLPPCTFRMRVRAVASRHSSMMRASASRFGETLETTETRESNAATSKKIVDESRSNRVAASLSSARALSWTSRRPSPRLRLAVRLHNLRDQLVQRDLILCTRLHAPPRASLRIMRQCAAPSGSCSFSRISREIPSSARGARRQPRRAPSYPQVGRKRAVFGTLGAKGLGELTKEVHRL